jgi:hypothetical protein
VPGVQTYCIYGELQPIQQHRSGSPLEVRDSQAAPV